MASNPNIRAYVERRIEKGKQTRFGMRCPERHVAGEILELHPNQHATLTT